MRNKLFSIGAQPGFITESLFNKTYEKKEETPKKKVSKTKESKESENFKPVFSAPKVSFNTNLAELRTLNLHNKIEDIGYLGLVDPLNYEESKDHTIFYQINDQYDTYEPFDYDSCSVQFNFKMLQKRMGTNEHQPVELARRLSLDSVSFETLEN